MLEKQHENFVMRDNRHMLPVLIKCLVPFRVSRAPNAVDHYAKTV
jgi:hypothetical protein